MKEDDGKRYDENGKKLAFLKGKIEGLHEAMEKMKGKSKSIGSSFWNNFTHNLAKYFAGFVMVFLLGWLSFWYIGKKTDEVVTSVKTEFKETVSSVKDSIPHPIDATKKWFNNGTHFWSDNNDTNKSEEKVIQVEKSDENKTSFTDKIKGFFSSDDNISVDFVDENISEETNKTNFFTKAKSWFSWSKDKNSTKENK